jgi:hypothetical protein
MGRECSTSVLCTEDISGGQKSFLAMIDRY